MDYAWAMMLSKAARAFRADVSGSRDMPRWGSLVRLLWRVTNEDCVLAQQRWGALSHVQQKFGYTYTLATYLLTGVWYLRGKDAEDYIEARVRTTRDLYIRSLPGWTCKAAYQTWSEVPVGAGTVFDALDVNIGDPTSACWYESEEPAFVPRSVAAVVITASEPLATEDHTLWYHGIEDPAETYARARIALALRAQQEPLVTIRARARFLLSQTVVEYSDQYELALKYLDKFIGWPEP